MSIRVEPATADRWDDVEVVLGGRGPDTCWCRRFLGHDEADNRAALHREVLDSPVPVGLVAYVDDAPAGWTRVVPRNTLPGVTGNRALQRVLGDSLVDESAWWITCFAVRREHRRSGVGTALLEAAVEHARRHGASTVEGHPVDVAGLTAAHVSGSALFTGTLAMFVAAGFTEVARTYRTRPVMRRELAPRPRAA